MCSLRRRRPENSPRKLVNTRSVTNEKPKKAAQVVRADSNDKIDRGERFYTERVDREQIERREQLERDPVERGERVEREKLLVQERIERGSRVEQERAERVRSKSVSESPTTPSKTTPPVRKRTSSGVFQVDETEPPSKKTELVKSNSDITRKKAEKASNGRRRTVESDTGVQEVKGKARKKGKEEKVIIEKFDRDAKSKCVTAFKESDSWD